MDRRGGSPRTGRSMSNTTRFSPSVRLAEDNAPGGRLAGYHASSRFLGSIEGDTPNGGFRFGGDAVFGFAGAVPVAQKEAAWLVDLLLEIVVRINFVRRFIAVFLGSIEERPLHLLEERHDLRGRLGQ